MISATGLSTTTTRRLTISDVRGITVAMTKTTSGRDLLLAFVRDRRKPGAVPPGCVFVLAAFAKCVGVSRQQLRAWLQGDVKPNDDHRTQLAILTQGQVPASSWDLD